MTTRILIVDDHQMIGEGLRAMLERIPGHEVVRACGDCATAWLEFRELRIHTTPKNAESAPRPRP